MSIPLDEERLAFAEELEEVALQLSLLDPGMDIALQREQVDAEYERLGMTAGLYAWPDMAAVIDWSRSALQSAAAPELLADGKFFGWLEMAALVLREPDDVAHLPMLTMELMDEAWPQPMPPDLLQRFLLGLRGAASDSVPNATSAGSTEQDTSAPPEVMLSFAGDVHPELLAAYLEETPGHVADAARLIRLIAIGVGNPEQKRHASRLVHTIKGSSGVVGVEAIAGFTHQLEDLLDLPFKVLPEGLGNTLEEAADCLESMFDHLRAGLALPDEYARLHVRLADWIDQLADQAREGDDASSLEDSLATLTALPDFLRGTGGDEAGVVSAGIEGAPVGVGLGEERIQRLLSLSGELITSTSQSAELLQQAGRLGKQLYQQDEQILQHLDELDSLIEQQSLSSQKQPKTSLQLQEPDKDQLDELELESYSDLYGATSLLAEAAADSRQLVQGLQHVIRQLTEELYQQQRVQRQLSDAVLATRLTPVSALTARMERIVRETCRKTGKKAEIFVQGQHLQVDADILKGIGDPLLHLLRNAVDHGIESPEVRQAAGKDETGRINLSFTRRGNHISLLLEDDGAGMDVDRIRERAIKRGLIAPDSELPEESLLRLVLQPGFSTRDEVSEVSGRGVGMDVVQSAIQQMRGTLSLQSERGVGSRVSIDLPQTLIATHALVVRTGGHLVAVPADTIEQLLYVAADENRIDEQGDWHIETSRYQLPVTQLAHVLHWPAAEVIIRQTQTLMIVRSETQAHAFYVEEIFPSRDIVVKSLAPWLGHLPGVQGACILATGQVAPVLDMIRLLHELESGGLQPKQLGNEHASRPVRPSCTLLVVDDSLSNRKALRLMLEGMGYGVLTAVDGLDALQVLHNSKVDMVLTDLEMPRMNGLEFTRAIRIWPEVAYLPVLMITSRGTRKHRDLAQQAGVDGYLTKPVPSSLLQEQVRKWLDA